MSARLFGLGTSLARMLLQAAGIVVLVFVLCRVVPGDAVGTTWEELSADCIRSVQLRDFADIRTARVERRLHAAAA